MSRGDDRPSIQDLTPFLPATVFFRPFRVRALHLVRWPRTRKPSTVAVATVAADVAHALDVLLDLATQHLRRCSSRR